MKFTEKDESGACMCPDFVCDAFYPLSPTGIPACGSRHCDDCKHNFCHDCRKFFYCSDATGNLILQDNLKGRKRGVRKLKIWKKKTKIEEYANQCKKLMHYEEQERKLSEIFGGTLTISDVIDTLVQRLEEPEKKHPLFARVLTYEDAEEYDAWKQNKQNAENKNTSLKDA